MTLYGGIDLHSNNVMISLIDQDERLISEKRLPNDLELIQHHLAPFQHDVSALVVGPTYNWYWLVDGLIESGYDVRLANTLAIQQYNGIKYTDDASDARFLAQLLRLGILPEGYIYPAAQRSTRDLLRRRLLLVQQRRTQYMSLQSMIACNKWGDYNTKDGNTVAISLKITFAFDGNNNHIRYTLCPI